MRNNVREHGTWARRQLGTGSDSEIRTWGGMNLFLLGDFWQFNPIQDVAIFGDPFATYKLSSIQTVLEAFWSVRPDSINVQQEDKKSDCSQNR